MIDLDDYQDVEGFVDDNREMLKRVLRHSNDTYARACAWALIDAGSDEPELDQLESELQQIKEAA